MHDTRANLTTTSLHNRFEWGIGVFAFLAFLEVDAGSFEVYASSHIYKPFFCFCFLRSVSALPPFSTYALNLSTFSPKVVAAVVVSRIARFRLWDPDQDTLST